MYALKTLIPRQSKQHHRLRKSLLIHEKPHLNYDSFFFFVRICHCRWPCPRPWFLGFVLHWVVEEDIFFLFSIPDVVQQSDSRGINLSPAKSDSAFQERQHPLRFRRIRTGGNRGNRTDISKIITNKQITS